MSSRLLLLLLVMVMGGCAAQLDLRTAVEHEIIAQHHTANVEQAEAVATVRQNTEPMPSGSEMDQTGAGRFSGVVSDKAQHEVELARRHEQAARRIRDSAGIACSRVPASLQVSCPVDVQGRVEPLHNGVRIVLAGSPSAEALRAQIDCALARARVDHPGDWATCPLYTPGASTRVVDRPDRVSIEIVTGDEAEAQDLRRRLKQTGASAP